MEEEGRGVEKLVKYEEGREWKNQLRNHESGRREG